MFFPRPALLSLALFSAACGEGMDPETPPRFAGSCAIVAAEPVSGEDAPLGFTAEQVAGLATVRGGYVLLWGADPSAPSSRLEVGIEAFDPARVFFVRESVGRMGDVEVPCPQALTFKAVIRFRSADGAFDESVEVDLFATEVGRHEWVGHVPLESLRGSFEPAAERGWTHRGVNFAGRFDHGAAVGGLSLTSQAGSDVRIGTLGYWGENPPAY